MTQRTYTEDELKAAVAAALERAADFIEREASFMSQHMMAQAIRAMARGVGMTGNDLLAHPVWPYWPVLNNFSSANSTWPDRNAGVTPPRDCIKHRRHAAARLYQTSAALTRTATPTATCTRGKRNDRRTGTALGLA